MNAVMVTGRIGNEPELKHTNEGTPVVTFSLAVRVNKEKTYWFDVVAWRGTAEFVCRYFHKGDGIEISGTLTQRVYSGRDGVSRNIVEIRADEIGFPLSKRDTAPSTPEETQKAIADTVEDFEDVGLVDDLPF